jgi:phosphatidylglycerophosphate synthase
MSDPAGRRPLKSRDVPVFKNVAAQLARAGVSPNTISCASIVFAAFAGAGIASTAYAEGWAARLLWFGSAAFIQLRLLANMLDGMVAVEGRRGGPTGDMWNEVPDRAADAAILIGSGFAGGSTPLLGFGAALMAVFVAYVRAFGASVGAGQIFLGPQAKPQRMAVMTIVCLLSAIIPMSPSFAAPLFSPVKLGLWIVILGGAITAARRLAAISRFLRSNPS